MFERLMRSPFFSSLALISMGWIALVITIETDISANEYHVAVSSQFGNWMLIASILFMIAWLLVYTVLVIIYNRKHPKYPIKFLTIMPPEIHETDEGAQWITYKACRKVYIFFYWAIPISLGVLVSLKDSLIFSYIPTIVLVFLGVGQYLVYWSETKKLYN